MRSLVFATFLMAASVGSAYAITANSHYDHSVNFEKYHTFAWKNSAQSATGIVNNSIVVSRIENSINEKLVQKGMREDDQNPDVYLVVHVGAKNIANYDYLPAVGGWRHWRWMGPDFVVNRYVQ